MQVFASYRRESAGEPAGGPYLVSPYPQKHGGESIPPLDFGGQPLKRHCKTAGFGHCALGFRGESAPLKLEATWGLTEDAQVQLML